MLSRALPGEQSPPASEFFDARIQRIVRESPHAAPSAAGHSRNSRRRMPWLPAAAAAGMALCFWGGTHFGTPAAPDTPSSPAPPAAPLANAPILYTPEQGVEAQMFESRPANAMVIVLDGVAAIPDSSEITAGEKPPRNPGTGMADAAVEPEQKIQ